MAVEFDLIRDHFGRRAAAWPGPALDHPQALGIGDDAALIRPLAPEEQLVVAVDTMVEGRHHRPDVDPAALGHKLLAVNLSDLAAMGATPLGFTLSLALRARRHDWLEAFAEGLFGLARQTGCSLVGGDTVSLPADAAEVYTVSIYGTVPLGTALRRDGLVPGDRLWVSGSLGDASLAVAEGRSDPVLDWPCPRLALGSSLRGLAHAAIDLSDGLVSELGHLVSASSAHRGEPLQAAVRMSALTDCLGPALRASRASRFQASLDKERWAAASGDAYELLFAAPVSADAAIAALSVELALPLHYIGEVLTRGDDGLPVVWLDADGAPLGPEDSPTQGFAHFSQPDGALPQRGGHGR
ncbi:MAG: thiamine-phosphate kinase [Burkholderiaceae bacterium]